MRVIIHGVGRSGTTVTQRIINNCSNVWITNEFLLYDLAFVFVKHGGRNNDNRRAYFRSLLIKDAWSKQPEHNPNLPPTLVEPIFVRECCRAFRLSKKTYKLKRHIPNRV